MLQRVKKHTLNLQPENPSKGLIKTELSTIIQAWRKKIVQNNKCGDTGKYVGEIY